jgi:hypothetical protein
MYDGQQLQTHSLAAGALQTTIRDPNDRLWRHAASLEIVAQPTL